MKILLIISVFINIVLYFGWVDVGQYRNYVDSTIELGQQFTESDEFQAIKDNTSELGTQIINNAKKDGLGINQLEVDLK